MQKKIEELARRFALKNAVQHNGKANSKAILGSVLGSMPEAKKDVPSTMKIIAKVVSDINAMSLDDQNKAVETRGIDTAIKKKEKEALKDLPDVGTGVVMRFAPNPNGPLSFGHSRQALLNWFYVKKYGGRYILRLDDTDPKVKTPLKDAYDWIITDLDWLGIKPDLIVRASDRFDIYYDHAQKLITMDKAYVCTCPQDTFRDLKKNATACPCRGIGPKKNIIRWKKMFDTYREGEAVLRIKTDIKHKNPAIRDWPAFRIVENPNHPFVNYRVWPLYDFASAIDDHLLGITHLIRGIDFIATKHKQGYIYDYFGWTSYPKDLVTGKLIVEGMKSTSQSRKMIESGELSGWDDPRLGTLIALKRRGFTPRAIIDFITAIGIKKSDIKVSEKNLYAYNKKLIDSISQRYFFTEDPVEIDISRSRHANTRLTISAPVEFQKDRVIDVGDAIYVSGKDYRQYRKKNIRLKGFTYGALEKNFIPSDDEDKIRGDASNIQVIQWVPKKDSLDVEIIMPDNTVITGKAESNISGINNKLVQFERVGFVNLTKINRKYIAYFAHP